LYAEFSPDDHHVVTVGLSSVRVWDAATGAPVGRPIKQEGRGRRVAFDPDGRRLIIAAAVEAVEAAIKTAAVATGKPGVVCFTGAYHGLTYGALALTDRSLFRAPFVRQLGGFATRVPYAYCHRCPIGLDYPACAIACLRLVEHALDGPDGADIGAVIWATGYGFDLGWIHVPVLNTRGEPVHLGASPTCRASISSACNGCPN